MSIKSTRIDEAQLICSKQTMIKTLIFDFGDVFINLDKQGAMDFALNKFQISELSEEMVHVNKEYEQGFISTETFLKFYTETFPNLSQEELIEAWNYIIKDFPKYRLEWLQKLKAENNFKFILLSNTNALHIQFIKENVTFYEDFKNCFDVFYLSHEIGYRKPNANIYEFVLNENNLNANECIFIDDTKENTDAAEKLGIHTWNIDETSQDVIDLLTVKADLF